jgi:hypothetical protein
MDVEFQVMFDGDIIFTMPFKVEHERDMPEFAKVALDACRDDLADISLLDEDIVMVWRKIETNSTRLGI